ncbi:tyrosine decarboxylase MfnA [Halosegnis rubeus]|mgnify:FL=1|jgi:tyrosine decarboxylase/aspartate 1-decarboxylase|uniref:Probable L-aspartate decarboxylase n=1 Tax=Halosegnis rubeus TaxID=2212850 RepID=A0A5N5U469_9EURY|nr:tyrosine decarboxylase MfnA [Halosegnis rubeus]KAB7513374.1 tyrosine decarboxylase MfnA [Halosegnis rubeus]KAB7517357.1 tyrosine decarboxylase MfnA [Halosegnis rubeus]KAB7518410.1 tyrosine decarboxylase MfnA [Halosegnis rubeus]
MELGIPQSFSRVLSSMCTEPHPAAREAAERFIATNPGDPGTYDTVADLESTVVDRLGEVAGLDEPAGYVASGGTEANVQALRLARNRADTPDPNVVVPASGHFSFTKAANVLGVELRVAPLDGYTVSLEAVEELLDADTVAVVGVAGSTEYGRVDPIPALADLTADAPGDPLLHVDAAWGGFVLPFTDYAWGFADAAVDTLTIDPHKMGQAVVPAGGLLAREESLLAELAVDTPYLESTSQITLTGTRSGAGVASAVAALDALWPDGYREQYETSQANAEWLAAELRLRGDEVVSPTLPLVAADIGTEAIDAVRDAGWRLSRTERGEARFVMQPHVTRETLCAFLTDLDRLR